MTDRETAAKIEECIWKGCEQCELSISECTDFMKTARKWLEEKVEQANLEKYGTTYDPADVALSDQTLKADNGKPELTLIPLGALIPIARVREYGVKKYGARESWREVSIERYQNAAFRHWLKYLNDPHGVDEESGLPHLWHCLCNLCFLTELEDLKE